MATNIVFIDSRVSDYQSLIDSLTEPSEVFILDGESDGLTQMASYLQGRTGIDALHIISHGRQSIWPQRQETTALVDLTVESQE